MSRAHQLRSAWVLTLAALTGGPVCGQQLEPRAYSVSPKGANFLVFGIARSWGDLSFDQTLPVEDAKARLQTAFTGYVRSMDFLGRSASVGVQVPYVWGPLQGRVSGDFESIYRSGLGDPAVRFAVNLWGAPAMNLAEFAKYRQRTNIGASIVVVAPLGQYDAAKLINIGSNRWAVKPEIGLSRRLGRWDLDLYAGVWIFGSNANFQGHLRSQNPVGSGQFHISYNLKPRLWAGFDATFYTGGRTSVDGISHTDLQRNSRIGGTISFPLSKHDSMKIAASTGAVTTIGAAFTTVAVSYQHLWGAGL